MPCDLESYCCSGGGGAGRTTWRREGCYHCYCCYSFYPVGHR
uniref:Uncharacterized protein LOC105637308 isoform X2 n=1 Tax=Rhizophora mucronata TaxID=61149 RepID=A0A2P2PP46_RHIMU